MSVKTSKSGSQRSPEKAAKSAFVGAIDGWIRQNNKYQKSESKITWADIEDCLENPGIVGLQAVKDFPPDGHDPLELRVPAELNAALNCGDKTWFAYSEKEKGEIVRKLEGKKYKRIFPRTGMIPWNSASRLSLTLPSAESPSTI